MKEITEKQIEHLTELSALSFSNPELKKMKNELEQILKFVDQIESVDVSNEILKTETLSLNSLREDKVSFGLTQEEALANAPRKEDGAYVVSKVVD